jgi:hypothetical protein
VARKKLLLIWAKRGFTSVVKRNQSFFASFLFTKKKIRLPYFFRLFTQGL